MKENWQGYAIAVLTSLLLGGVGNHLFSNTRIDRNYQQIVDISRTLAVMQEQIKYIREELDDR